MIELTPIRVTKDTRKELFDLGQKGDSYDDVIQKLLAHYKKEKKNVSV
jgi:predicted CopG family antitoxin